MIKLHLGCGKLYLPSYINIDINSDIADIKCDISNLNIYGNNSIDEIYICHVLEHFTKKQLIVVLKEYNRILKLGGILRIAVPDFDEICNLYYQNKNIIEITGLVNGGQKNIYDIHYNIFNFEIMKLLLNDFGFSNIEKYDEYEFLGDYDDYSKATIPHMSKKGRKMSLNILCTKNKDNINISIDTEKYLRL